MNVTLRFTKKRKRGRPSKEYKRIFEVSHNIPVHMETIAEDIQKYVEDNNLPVKIVIK